MENITEYSFPISQLLEQGDCGRKRNLIDYSGLGISVQHIPQLVQLATDPYYLGHCYDKVAMWGPVHACRALGQLSAIEATEPLVAILKLIDEDDQDWIIEELPPVFERFGIKATATLMKYIQNLENPLFARITALDGLIKIGKSDENFRNDCVEFLKNCLKNHINDHGEINANFIYGLVKFKDMDSVNLIQEAYESGSVDEMVIGDWEDIQIKLGLITRRTAPRRTYWDNLVSPNEPQVSQEFIYKRKRSRNRKEKIRKQNKQARKIRKNTARNR